MPKKHGPKKREIEREKKRVIMSEKNMHQEIIKERERTDALRSKPYSFIHPSIHLHLLIEIA